MAVFAVDIVLPSMGIAPLFLLLLLKAQTNLALVNPGAYESLTPHSHPKFYPRAHPGEGVCPKTNRSSL